MTEQERTDNFESLCGGAYRAGRLLDLYKACYPRGSRLAGCRLSRAEVFKIRAMAVGYSHEQVAALLSLQ